MTDEPRSFHAADWCDIPGRGRSAIIGSLAADDPLYDPDTLKGHTVTIDGKSYRVVGVETFAVPRSSERPYRGPFGLMVEEATEDG